MNTGSDAYPSYDNHTTYLKQKGSVGQLNHIRNTLKVHNNLIIRISCKRVINIDYLHKQFIIIFYFLLQ